MPVFSRYADFAERANRTVLSDRIENFISGRKIHITGTIDAE